ncbi:hypothetical protein HUJ05_003078 [Dendroctonus ponderosae]|nr:hypothetical protein HUJ05_003078 [Dendroctonus ponderosae]
MNFSSADVPNYTRVDVLPSQRQGRFLGPLLGFFLATLFPSLAIARLQQGSIKFQYDPAPSVHPPVISLFQTPLPTQAPIKKEPQKFQLEATVLPGYYADGPNVGLTNIGSADYLIPANSDKVAVKRAVSSRNVPAYRRNRYNPRRRFPAYLDYENYDYLTNLRLKDRRRNQARRPAGLNYDYDYDYYSPDRNQRRKQQKKKIKNNNRNYPDYYSDEDLDNDVEPVTVGLRPRQQQTTTDSTDATDATTTVITNGTTPATTPSSSAASGYGKCCSKSPYSGNENISITYGPPSAIKPVYGVPGLTPGAPLGEWTPTYSYEPASSYPSQHHGTYHNSAPIVYGSVGNSYAPQGASYSPSVSYGLPSGAGDTQIKPYPGPSYGAPSTSYGVPSRTYGVPGQSSSHSPASSNARASSYSSYQLPFSSWYGRSASHSDIVRRVQDIIKYD